VATATEDRLSIKRVGTRRLRQPAIAEQSRFAVGFIGAALFGGAVMNPIEARGILSAATDSLKDIHSLRDFAIAVEVGARPRSRCWMTSRPR
jgi:hypothetical protein